MVAPERTPPLLTSPDRRAALMREEGIEQVLILPFTRELAMLTPEEFVERLLVKALGARAVLVGDNFHFGHRQAGNVAVLAELGRKFGFETEIVPAVTWRGRVVSSSGIRELIRAGNVSLAARLLQHAYGLEGEVVSGRGVGSKQTVPTLNLATSAEVIPANGVYITRTRDQADGREWNSVTNIGYRPTFGASDQLSIETFLLDPLTGETPRAHPRGVSAAHARGTQVRYSGSAARADSQGRAHGTGLVPRVSKVVDGTGMHFLLSGLSIVLIDLLLAGDNALVIALAVRSLPQRERRIGIIGGAGAAVVLRVALTAVAARLLDDRVSADRRRTADSVDRAQGADRRQHAARPDARAEALLAGDLVHRGGGPDHVHGQCAGHRGRVEGQLLADRLRPRAEHSLHRAVEHAAVETDGSLSGLLYLGAGILGKVGGDMILTDPIVERSGIPEIWSAMRWRRHWWWR